MAYLIVFIGWIWIESKKNLGLDFTDCGNLFVAAGIAPTESLRRPVLHAALPSVQVRFADAPVSVGT